VQMSRNEGFGWVVAIGTTVALFLGMRAGWTPRRGYAFVQSVPLVIKGAHSFWVWMRKRGD
jgi:hypothetical protein